jgi:hypothetical protein
MLISLGRGFRGVRESQWSVGCCENWNGTAKQLPSFLYETA